MYVHILIWSIVFHVTLTYGRSYFTSVNLHSTTAATTTEKAKTTMPTTSTTIKPITTTSIVETLFQRDISIGPCKWVLNRQCPDSDILFYLYTPNNPKDRQYVYITDTLAKSNITESFFNPRYPTKIIIHGYNSDMFLHPLQLMKDEYMIIGDFNIFYVDWSVLAPGPCYMSAVYNTRHAGACVAQLVERILDMGSADIHVIGFSLGAQLSNYIARNLGSFLLPRITGLDPAMPLFITATDDNKLDPSDAIYVDVIHTNAIVQGKLERCGHADFYMNGGIMQPGCYNSNINAFACSHQRAPAYYMESIRTSKGFWGWQCTSFIYYMLGMCPPTNYLVEAGEHIKRSTRGMFIINTNDTSPYALGKWTNLPTLGQKFKLPSSPASHGEFVTESTQTVEPLLRHLDQWGKLDYTFNFILDNTIENPYYYTNNNKWLQIRNNANKFKTKDHVTNLTKDPVNWQEYRHNLTQGFIDKSIFQVPVIS